MTIAHDKESFLDFTSTNSWTHTPVAATIQGVAVVIGQTAVATDLVANVTYGGRQMQRIGRAQDTVTEPGAAYAYYLGEGVPQGAQPVKVTVSSGTDAKWGVSISITAATDTEVCAWGLVNEDVADPSVTLPTTAGFAGAVFNIFYSGLDAPATPTATGGATKLTGTDAGGKDFGVSSAVGSRVTGASGANVVSGWSTGAVSDDTAMVAFAVREITASKWFGVAGTTISSPLMVAGCKMWLDANNNTDVPEGAGISSWKDRSGSNNNADQATGGAQPLLRNNIQNFQPGVYFDGVDDFLGIATNPTFHRTSSAFFIVFKAVSGAADAPLVTRGAAQGYWFHGATNVLDYFETVDHLTTTAVNDSVARVYTGTISSSGDLNMYLNGTSDFTLVNLGAGTDWQPTVLGGASTFFFNGYMHEVIVYDAALSTTDRQSVEAYLKAKWATP